MGPIAASSVSAGEGADSVVSNTAPAAIVGVVAIERGADVEDWALGLADLLDLELQRRGLNTCERRDIRYVVGERQLQFSGNAEALRDFLPWANYLVKGSVRHAKAGFVLSISVADVQSGQVIKSVEQEGTSPSDVVAVLGRVADQVVASLVLQPGKMTRRLGILGFTDSPEVALLYYNGVEHLVSGHPGYAIRCFTDAAKADRSFMLARWWKMKAYQQAGLLRHARVALDEIEISGLGAGFLTQVRGGGNTGQVQKIVAVVAGRANSDEGRSIAAAFGERLRRDTSVTVFDPTWLPTIGAEADLDLTGLYLREPYLRSTMWAYTDIMAFILQGQRGGWRLVVRDSLSGEEQLAMPIDNQPASLDRAVAELCHVIKAQRESKAGPTTLSGRTASRGIRSGLMISSDNADELDQLLLRITGDDRRRDALMHLAQLYQYDESPYERATWESLKDSIDASEPDAAMWYSTALWHLHDKVLKTRMDMTDHFRVLFQKYPETLPAMFCRYSLACYYLEGVVPGPDYARARDILAPLADRMVTALPVEFRSAQLTGSIYFRAAQAFEGCGQINEATGWLDKARRTMVGADRGLRICYRIGIGYDTDLKPALLYDIVAASQSKTGNCLGDNIDAMTERLSGRPHNPAPGDHLSVAEIGAKADRNTGEDTYRLRRLYLEKVGKETQSDLRQSAMAKERTLRFANWLLAQTWTRDQRDELKRVAEQAARRLGLLDAVDFALAVGDYDEAARRAGEWTEDITCLAKGYPAAVRQRLTELRSGPLVATDPRITSVAEACMEVGLFDDATALFETAFTQAPANSDGRFQIAREWACCEMHRGNGFKASGLLRSITEEGSGADPHSALWQGAMRQLRNLRIAADSPSRCADWLPMNRPQKRHVSRRGFAWVPPLTTESIPAMEDDIYRIVRTMWGHFYGNQPIAYSVDRSAIDRYVATYGGDAVPAVIKASEQTWLHFRAVEDVHAILKRLAGPPQYPIILESFCHDPDLAGIAFDIAPQESEAITMERLPALRGRSLPFPLAVAIIKHRVMSAYPYLFRAIAENGAGVHAFAPQLGDALQKADTNLVEQFRFAIGAYLGDALRRDDDWVAPGGGIVSVFELAMQYGVVEGVHALVEYHYARMSDADKYAMLSKYVELSEYPSDALTLLREQKDSLRWHPELGKFRISTSSGTNVTDRRVQSPPLSDVEESGTGRLRILTFIDGCDLLKVRGNAVWFEHLTDALPGRWAGLNHPTYINKQVWVPAWVNNTSEPYESKRPFLFSGQVSVREIAARGIVTIEEQPDKANNFTLVVRIDDKKVGGAAWYEFELRWNGNG